VNPSGGQRTARENVADLCDPGSFVEYGGFAYAAQTQPPQRRRTERNTPADGMVTGRGQRERPALRRAGLRRHRAGRHAGLRNHQKTDRLLGLALDQRLPVVLFAEGGGGRPGDTDMPIVAGLHVTTFASFAKLSGQVPVVGMRPAAALPATRRCWAAAM
jgi:acetyl-CoA carboxylase carboxyltransferase component